MSHVEAKYLNFTKNRRPSFTNYLQKSKKSFIGYDPDMFNDRRASTLSKNILENNSWYIDANNKYRKASTNSYIKRLTMSKNY